MFPFNFVPARMIIATAVTALLAACGGGDSTVAGVGSGGTGYIAGFATKGPVASATIAAYGISNGQMAGQIGSATSDLEGRFSMAIGNYAGPVLLQMSGGRYTDEATGASMPMESVDVMTAVMPGVVAGASNADIQLTPVTAMAQAMAQQLAGGMTDANIAVANRAVGNYFSVSDILHVQPMNPLLPGAGASASQDAKNYGMTLAAMSKYAQIQGMSYSSAMVTAMMNDASDGVMNGRKGANPIAMSMGGMMGNRTMASGAGTSHLADAMAAFMSSRLNASGVSATDMAALMEKLTKSNGNL